MTSFLALTLLFVQKRSCLYNKKKITPRLEDMNFIFSKIKFISWRRRVISSIYIAFGYIAFRFTCNNNNNNHHHHHHHRHHHHHHQHHHKAMN